MARGRMISKAISLDEKVNALSDDTARLLFTWLVTHLDCEGRMHGDPTTVKSVVFPRRNISTRRIEKYLKELEKTELILRYSVNGNDYLWMKSFEKHQTGLKKDREAQSQIPPFAQDLIRSKVEETPIEVKDKVQVKDKDNKGKYGEFQNVLLTNKEYQGLKDQFGAEADTLIEKLSAYMESKGKRYKSHYATLLNWQRNNKEGKGGKSRNSRGLPDPKDYTESPDYPDLKT